MARFFWGVVGDERKIHWLSWRQICVPQVEGVLGIRRLSDMMKAFSYKLLWWFQAKESFWAKFLWSKYQYPFLKFSNVHSPIWLRLIKVGFAAHEFIRWSLGSGRISFWDDIWFRDKPLSKFHPNDTVHPCVSSTWSESTWDLNLLHDLCATFYLLI